MVERTFFYTNNTERRTTISTQNSQGFKLISDTFVNRQGKPTRPGEGKLVFNNNPRPPDPTPTPFAGRNQFVDSLAERFNATYPGIT